jgi:hypothetical protein
MRIKECAASRQSPWKADQCRLHRRPPRPRSLVLDARRAVDIFAISILELGDGSQPGPRESEIPLPAEWRVFSFGWARQGNGFFATVAAPDYQIVRIGLDGKTSVLLDRARDAWLGDVAASADGLHLAFNQQTFEANVWLLEEF